jgi:phage antirepressor YoqD-like protein
MENLTDNTIITSLELAELTGMVHSNLLKALRKMEDAWVKSTGVKFNVSTYKDGSGKSNVMYNLNKTESLYVISKFKDEIRAKVILRWEELENQKPKQLTEEQILLKGFEILSFRNKAQEKQLKAQAPKVAYFNQVMQSKSTYNTNQIAKEFGFSAVTLNKMLAELDIQYKQNGTWLLYSRYQNKNYTKTKTFTYTGTNGEIKTSMQTCWTEQGRAFIHEVVRTKQIAENAINDVV